MPCSHDNSPKKELATNQNVAQNAQQPKRSQLSSDPLKIGVEDSRLFPTLTRTYFRHAMPPLQLPTIKIPFMQYTCPVLGLANWQHFSLLCISFKGVNLAGDKTMSG